MTDKKTRDERVEALLQEFTGAYARSKRTPHNAGLLKLFAPFAERLVDTEDERDEARRERDDFRRICVVCRKKIEDETDRLCTTFNVPRETVEERPDGTTVYRAMTPDEVVDELFVNAHQRNAARKLLAMDDLRARVERLEVAVAGHLARTNPGGYAGDWAVRELLAKEAIAIDVAEREEVE